MLAKTKLQTVINKDIITFMATVLQYLSCFTTSWWWQVIHI